MGFQSLATPNRDAAKMLGYGYKGETFQRDAADNNLAFTTGDIRAMLCGFQPGDVISNILFICSSVIQTITLQKVAVWDSAGNILGSSASNTTNIPTGLISQALTTPVAAPSNGIAYLGAIIVATTVGSLGATTAVTGKEAALGAGPQGSALKAGQADIVSLAGAANSNSSPWYGWS